MMTGFDSALPPNAWLPLLVLTSSLVPGLVIFFWMSGVIGRAPCST